MEEKGKICFVIAPIGEKGGQIRKRSDQILNYIIRPAAEECRYKAIRADEIEESGLITYQVINHVMDDPMVVADLTGWNPNVFYELAVRHTVRKPFVLLFQPQLSQKRIPFDVAGLRAVALHYPDWDSIEDDRENLIRAIRATEKMDPEQLATPITRAINVQALSKSEDPTANILAGLASSIQRLEMRVMNLTFALSLEPSARDMELVMRVKDLEEELPTPITAVPTIGSYERFQYKPTEEEEKMPDRVSGLDSKRSV